MSEVFEWVISGVRIFIVIGGAIFLSAYFIYKDAERKKKIASGEIKGNVFERMDMAIDKKAEEGGEKLGEWLGNKLK